MREPGNFGRKNDILARQRRGGFDFGKTEAQDVGLAFAISRARREFGQRCLDIEILTIHVSIGAEWVRNVIAAEPVDRVALPGRRAQAQLIGLPVHRDEFIGQVGQRADRHRSTADLCTRPPVGTHDPAEQQRVVVEISAELVEQLGDAARRPRAVGRRWPRERIRTRPAQRRPRPPNSRPRPVTTIVLPAPVSPVTTVRPGESSSTASSMTPRSLMRSSSSTIGCYSGGRTPPRQPRTGRPNLATSRSVNGPRVQPGELQPAIAAARLYPRTGNELGTAPAVTPDHPDGLGAEHLDRQGRARRHDHGPGRTKREH